MQDCLHLHVHTQYSTYFGMKGIAVTDHGNIYSVSREFYELRSVNKKNNSG